jgi:hypothetical protein
VPKYLYSHVVIIFRQRVILHVERYCQVGINSPPPALMMLCIVAAEAYHEEKDGIDLLDRRVPVGSK